LPEYRERKGNRLERYKGQEKKKGEKRERDVEKEKCNNWGTETIGM
jgi:hypothetical protein